MLEKLVSEHFANQHELPSSLNTEAGLREHLRQAALTSKDPVHESSAERGGGGGWGRCEE